MYICLGILLILLLLILLLVYDKSESYQFDFINKLFNNKHSKKWNIKDYIDNKRQRTNVYSS